jgi:hypothetical protein
MTRSTVLIVQYDLPNGCLASQNFTNLLGYTKIPEPEPEPGQLMIPINLVFQMSDFRYEIKRNFITLYLTWNIDWKSGSVRLNEHEQLILVPGWLIR